MSAPKFNLKGIVDESIRQKPYVERPRSVHTPLVMLMTKRGPVDPVYLDIDGFDIFYSLQSLGENSPWWSHQSRLVEIALEVSNSTLIVKRIIDEHAKIASTVIGLDVEQGRVIDKTLDKHSADVNLDKFVPLFTIEAADPGTWGNYVGIEIFKSDDTIQNTLGVELGAVVYDAVIIIEDEKTGRRSHLPNLFGESVTRFVLKRDAISNGIDYYFDEIMKRCYIEEQDNISRQAWFSDFKFHLEEAATKSTSAEYWKTDLLTNILPEGAKGFVKGKSWFCKGGDDGFPNETGTPTLGKIDKQRRYDEAVRHWLTNITDSSPITDMAKYPFSTIWDTGFTKETKLAFTGIQKLRKDIWIAASVPSKFKYTNNGNTTYFEPSKELTTQESISLASYYRTMFSLNLESTEYGTPYARGILVLQDGVNKKLGQQRNSLIYAIFRMVAEYCGSSSGKWTNGKAFDTEDNNVLNGWYDVSCDYLAPTPKELAWDAGVIYAQNKNINSMFFPAFQTLYPNDTSVLNNIFTMMACCHIQHVHYKAWAMVTGNTKYADDQLAEQIDLYMNKELRGVFDDRFIIEVKTSFNPVDKANGYSWTTETFIYSNMTRHLGTFRVIARRMPDDTITTGEITWR